MLPRSDILQHFTNYCRRSSLRTDAKNSIKDGSASVVAFLSVLIQLGFSQMDAIGGITKVTDLIGQTIEDKFKKKDQVKVRSILLHPAGMKIVFAAVHIEVDGNKRLADVELVTSEVEMAIRSKIPYIKKI